MPQHQLIPDHLERTARAWRRYKRLMIWMALAALVAVVLALIYLKATVGDVPIHMLIATIAGVGFSVLLGTALMGLVYFSNASGHDEGAHRTTSSMEARDEAATTRRRDDDSR
jgi:hypothetical protein